MAMFPSPDELMIDFTHLRNEQLRNAQHRRSIRIARARAAAIRPRPRSLRLRHALTGAFSWHPALSARSSPSPSSSRQTATAPGPAPPGAKP